MATSDKDVDKLLEFIRAKEKLKGQDIKSPDYKSPLEQDTMVVKGKPAAPEPITRIAGATEHIDTKGVKKIISGDDFTEKIARLRGLKAAGKKALGILPFAGAAAGLMSGDPAMAAEEAAGDVIPGYEAVRSENAGMSPEDEKIMLAEDAARKNYNRSPAALDKLKAMISRAPAAIEPDRTELSKQKVEGLTGMSQDSLKKQAGKQDLQAQYDQADDETRKKIRQRAHLMGQKLED